MVTWIALKSDIMGDHSIPNRLTSWLPLTLFHYNGSSNLPHILGDIGRDFEAYSHSRGRFASKLQCPTNRSVDFCESCQLTTKFIDK
jgi:hypothetical protein